MKHKSMPRFLSVLSPLENLQRKKKTAVSRTNSAFIVVNQAIWREPRPRNPVTTCTTTTQEEAPLDEDDSSSHVTSLYHDVYAGTLPTCPFSAPIPEDF